MKNRSEGTCFCKSANVWSGPSCHAKKFLSGSARPQTPNTKTKMSQMTNHGAPRTAITQRVFAFSPPTTRPPKKLTGHAVDWLNAKEVEDQ